MNESEIRYGIPLEVIQKGRGLGEVLAEFHRVYSGANKSATEHGKLHGWKDSDIFADTLIAVAYRMYLFGVEDGMKGEQK